MTAGRTPLFEMITININTDDLLKWSRYMNTVPKRTRPAIARALNAFGDNILRGTAATLADRTGLAVDDIAGMIKTNRADADHLTWEMDASAVVLGSEDGSRPWESRQSPEFDNTTLVRIVTADDETVCPICTQAAADSPYTMAEVVAMQKKWVDYVPPHPVTGTRTNLIHPNCRCAIQPWTATRRLPVTFDRPGAAPPQLFTARQLGELVAGELEVAIRTVG